MKNIGLIIQGCAIGVLSAWLILAHQIINEHHKQIDNIIEMSGNLADTDRHLLELIRNLKRDITAIHKTNRHQTKLLQILEKVDGKLFEAIHLEAERPVAYPNVKVPVFRVSDTDPYIVIMEKEASP